MYQINEDEKNVIIDSLLNYEEILNPDFDGKALRARGG